MLWRVRIRALFTHPGVHWRRQIDRIPYCGPDYHVARHNPSHAELLLACMRRIECYMTAVRTSERGAGTGHAENRISNGDADKLILWTSGKASGPLPG